MELLSRVNADEMIRRIRVQKTSVYRCMLRTTSRLPPNHLKRRVEESQRRCESRDLMSL
ncbi:unnamed protein product [Brassica oleracea]